jgi:hypothetical protein
VAAAINLAGLRIHDLRHTAVALWIAAGASPKEVAARAGRTSVSFVLEQDTLSRLRFGCPGLGVRGSAPPGTRTPNRCLKREIQKDNLSTEDGE